MALSKFESRVFKSVSPCLGRAPSLTWLGLLLVVSPACKARDELRHRQQPAKAWAKAAGSSARPAESPAKRMASDAGPLTADQQRAAALAGPKTPPHASAADSASKPVCRDWQVGMTGRAVGSLETYCAAFPPCPRTPRAAGALGFFGMLPRVEVFAEGAVMTYGSTEEGRLFAFDPNSKLVGASNWQAEPFGPCGKSAIRYEGGVVPEPGASSTVRACHYVPGRELTMDSICRCAPAVDRPPLVGLDRGPVLRLPLDCLYELGAAGTLCAPSLDQQRDMPEAELSSPGCGWTKVASPLMDSECVYDAGGRLREMRLGKRYVSSGFGAPCRP